MKRILVTGGLGYIGSHTAVTLIEKGFEVIIIDNLYNSTLESLDGIEAITGTRPHCSIIDLCKSDDLKDFFEEQPHIDAAIHFAAYKAVKESVDHPLSYYNNNLIALLNLSDCLAKNETSILVYSSSAAVYGDNSSVPFTESSALGTPLSPYGNTKKMGEEILRDIAKSNPSFSVISLRYFNPIGAHESALIGESPSGVPNNLMPFITQTAAGLRQELLVYGDDYHTPDGTAIRDYIHIMDLASAHVKAVDRLLSKSNINNYEVFNLGTGKGSSVLEVISSFEKTSGAKLLYRIVDRRPGDIPEMYASTALAKQELGWTSEYDLDEMTLSAWSWEQHLLSKGTDK